MYVWRGETKVYSALDKEKFIFKVGWYLGHFKIGELYTIKQSFVYEYETWRKVQAIFKLNIIIR